jgi:carbon monoxide dehydrogenase subunit G
MARTERHDMFKRIVLIAGLAGVTGGLLLADFTYEQTTKITGGAMMSMVKVAGVFSRQLREPMRSTVMVKGNRMAHVMPDTATIIDLDKETITEINFKKKTYSVITFAQMADALKQLDAKLKSEKGGQQMDISIKPSVKNTGQTRDINGMSTHEAMLTMEFEGTDQKTQKRGTFMVMVSDMWLAPDIAGYQEVQQFYQRMSQKLAWTPGGNMFMQSPQASKGMAEMMKELCKINGVPVYQVTKMNMGEMTPAMTQSAPPPQQQVQTEEEKPKGGALGRLGGRLGSFGGFGRKKEEPAQEQAQQPSGPTSLMETTTELSGFSAGPVDGSKFEVPAGFKQVDSETLKNMNR